MAGEFATAADGVRLWWSMSDNGPPIVLVPGRGDSTDIYPVRFSERLPGRVVRYDPRDTGLSDDGGSAYTLSDLADDVLAVMDAAQVHAAHLVGLSMGGLMLVDLALRIRARVRSLTFVSCVSPDPAAGIGDDFFDMLGADDPAATIVRAMHDPTEADRAWVAAEVARETARAPLRAGAGMRHQEAAMRSAWPDVARLEMIAAPALVIHGGHDRKLPLAHAHALARIPGAQLVVIDDMGHLPRPAQWDAVGTRVARHIAAVD